jgi:hypothetical protein
VQFQYRNRCDVHYIGAAEMNIIAVLIVGALTTSVAIWTVVSVLRKEKALVNRPSANRKQIEFFTKEALNAFVEKRRVAVQEVIHSELNPTTRLDADEWVNLSELEKSLVSQDSLIRSLDLSNVTFVCETHNRGAESDLVRRETEVADPVGNKIVDLRRVLLEAGGALTPEPTSALST